MKLIMQTANVVGNEENCLYPNRVEVSSAEELQAAVRRDHVCAEYKGNYRSSVNFLSSNCVVMDCDNDHTENPDEWITPEKLAEIVALSEEAVSLGAEIEEIRGGYENEEDMPDEEQRDLAVKAKRRREAERRMRQLRSELDGDVLKKYAALSEEEIRVLVFGVKWMGRLSGRIGDEVSRAFGWYHERVVEIARRYERSLPEILREVDETRAAVEGALGRMGYKW